jgi:D-tyrosyl-tRNA(Tyr) deacylase
MRAVAQRVRSARVEVAGETVAAIDHGLLALVGVTHSDTSADATALAAKLAGLRIFGDAAGKMNLSVADVGGEVLVVSQFTLYGDASRGRRPSFTAAAPPEVAAPLVQEVAAELGRLGVPVAEGRFGAAMRVELVNDGPVTLVIEVGGAPG